MVVRMLVSLGLLGLAMALLVFLPAGTVHYWQAWVFLAVYLAVSLVVALYLLWRDPALVQRRMKGGPTAEPHGKQKIIMGFASLGFCALLVVPGLDHRFGWSAVPALLVACGDALVAIGFFLVVLVLRENTFAAATVQVAEGQRVISTGPYAVVRHPMYAFSFVYALGIPLALASWWGLLGVAFMFAFIVWRLLDEERLLARDLPGYAEYQRRVRYRLVPHVW